MKSLLYPRITASRRVISMDGMWKIKFDFESEGEALGFPNGFESKDLIPVPASFADFYTEKELREYTGDFWYETEVIVPGEWKEKEIFLRFAAATHRAVVYFNGKKVAEHEGGFLPFTANITDVALFDTANKVVVKVNNELSEATLPAGQTITLPTGRKMSKPYFDFYNYSGLQRSVNLIALPKVSITDFSLVHHINGKDAMVDYTIETTGEIDGVTAVVEVFDETGMWVARAEGHSGTIVIPDVRLWKVRDAYLYRFVFRLMKDDVLLDEYVDHIGIRTVEIKNTDILINGEPVYLKGFGKHEDSFFVGRGFNIGVMKRDFELMKWIGANSFRTSHYPYSEEIYQMADREGFLVIDEVAAVGMFEGLMFAVAAGASPRIDGYFSKDTTPELLKNHLEAVSDMIQRDKNHACVFAWSLLNEPDTLTESATRYFKEIFELALEADPQKRPRTFAMVAYSQPETCKCHQYADFLSFNRYNGWYSEGGYEISAGELVLRGELDRWGALNLNKPMIFTEYGADTYPAEHKLPSVMWSQEYQVELLDIYSRIFDSYPFIKGEQVWNFADFQTTEGIMRLNGNKKGIFTRDRQPKDSAFYFKKRWESLPINYKSET